MNDDTSDNVAAEVSSAVGAYTREARAASDLAELRRMRPAHVLASLDGRSPEALVAVMREWVRSGDSENAWKLCERLIVGIEPWVKGRMGGLRWITSTEREDILASFAVRLYEEWMTCDGRHSFWEVRFWRCLKLRFIDVLRMRRQREISTDPTQQGALETVAAAISPEDWALAMLSLDRLPAPTRKAFVMKYYEGYTEDQIAAFMGVTARTIRNWIRQGHEAMKEADIPEPIRRAQSETGRFGQ